MSTSSTPLTPTTTDERAPRAVIGQPAREARTRALLALLGDESPIVWDAVRRELSSEGGRVLRALRRRMHSSDARARAHARTLVDSIERQRVVRRLVRYVSRAEIDLERALFLLARLAEPRLDVRPFQRALDAYAAELLERGRSIDDPAQRLRLIPAYLGRELAFGGSRGDFHHPGNVHLPRVIEQRAGLPLTLSAVYVLVARRIGVQAGILPIPGHVMVRLTCPTESVIIDPYHKGQERSEREVRRYVEQNRLPFDPAMLREASDRSMLKRQILNLVRCCEQNGKTREVEDLALLLHALELRSGRSMLPRGANPRGPAGPSDKSGQGGPHGPYGPGGSAGSGRGRRS